MQRKQNHAPDNVTPRKTSISYGDRVVNTRQDQSRTWSPNSWGEAKNQSYSETNSSRFGTPNSWIATYNNYSELKTDSRYQGNPNWAHTDWSNGSLTPTQTNNNGPTAVSWGAVFGAAFSDWAVYLTEKLPYSPESILGALVPVIGPGREAFASLMAGRFDRALVYVGLTVLDVTIVGGAVAKGLGFGVRGLAVGAKAGQAVRVSSYSAMNAIGNGLSATRDAGIAAACFFYDARNFRTISKIYWSGIQANGRSLHHWLIPQRASWISVGIRNAGWNVVELPAMRGVFHRTLGLNQWMGFARNWGPESARQAILVENIIRIGIPMSVGSTGYMGFELGGALGERIFWEW